MAIAGLEQQLQVAGMEKRAGGGPPGIRVQVPHPPGEKAQGEPDVNVMQKAGEVMMNLIGRMDQNIHTNRKRIEVPPDGRVEDVQ